MAAAEEGSRSRGAGFSVDTCRLASRGHRLVTSDVRALARARRERLGHHHHHRRALSAPPAATSACVLRRRLYSAAAGAAAATAAAVAASCATAAVTGTGLRRRLRRRCRPPRTLRAPLCARARHGGLDRSCRPGQYGRSGDHVRFFFFCFSCGEGCARVSHSCQPHQPPLPEWPPLHR